MTKDQKPTASGVVFPATADGRRSTAALGQAVVADALRPVDPAGALAVEQEAAWRRQYLGHFRRLLEAGLTSPENWRQSAATGLETVHSRMSVVLPDGGEIPLAAALTEPAGRALETVEVTGPGEPGEFVLPYRGRHLRGDEIRRQLAAWVAAGVAEPSVADAVDTVLAHPEWLRLDGRTVVVLGAGAEMGPLSALLGWGATVAAVDLPRPDVWKRILPSAVAGRLLVPAAPETPGRTELATRAGADLITEVPAVAEWLTSLPGSLVLGNYAYADGSGHVRVAAAVDALTQRLQKEHDDLALAFLATPTDVFAVPGEAVQFSTDGYRRRSRTARLLRTVSRGRLLAPAYPESADPGICDSLVPIQGPNYALAKQIQRWRAVVARSAGTTVSFHVAPATRTRSVTQQRLLAAVYSGVHHFGLEIFAPATANTLMAALLVHDLNSPPARHEHPWQDEAHQAVHGGLWRTPYDTRSALGLAAILGYPSR